MRKPFHQDFKLTQPYGNAHLSKDAQGNSINPYARFNLLGHNGLDYALPTGTDVLAPHSGKVIEVAFDTGYGNYIKIENDKEGSVLAHLKDVLVPIGSAVTEGQLIAHSNNTGNSTGPHLHWGYYTFPRNRQNGFNGFIDQLPLLKVSIASDQQKIIDQLRKERDDNWNLYKAKEKEFTQYKQKMERIERAFIQVQQIFNDLS